MAAYIRTATEDVLAGRADAIVTCPITKEGLRRAVKRMEKQSVKEDRFEKEALDFHRRVREGYLVLAKREPKRIIILDGMKEEQTLHREIISLLPSELRG